MMTLRELLQALQTTDEKSLDQPVMIAYPSGAYDSIAKADFHYIGAAVIHLEEPARDIPDWFNKLPQEAKTEDLRRFLGIDPQK
jgi:hypothetical protein